MDKTLTFDIFRFHLLPISTKQISIFDKEITYEELKEKKNTIFDEIVRDLQNRVNQFPLELYSTDETHYLFRLANPKKTIIYKDFKEIIENTEPYIYIAINTDPTNQKIAISHNPEAFTATSVSKNNLHKIFSKYLSEDGLSIEFEQLFESNTFWNYARKYEGRIKTIDFEIIKPNLAKISEAIKNTLKPLIEETNSHKTHLRLEAPREGVLENIDRENKKINGLVEYSSEGGGNISMNIIGLKHKVKTKNMTKTKKIKEIQLKGSQDQIIKIWKDLVD